MMTHELPTSHLSRTRDAGCAEQPLDGQILQRLIDEAPAGKLILPPGDYLMRDSLRLRSGLHLDGRGQVRLFRAPHAKSPLTQITGYGLYELVLANASSFEAGTGVTITDSRGGGFGVTSAKVVRRDGNRIIIDKPVGRDFRPDNQAVVQSIFPMISGIHVQHATVAGVIVEGDGADAWLDGCRDAGVYLLGCRDIRITQVEVSGYAGDGISFQQCIDVYVDRCHLHDNSGHGLHPGSGSVRYVLRENRIESNRNCGIYYCLRTTHSHCLDNQIAGNGTGISVGELDTDHLIRGNTIKGNVKQGVAFRAPVRTGGDRVVVTENTIENNAADAGGVQIFVPAGTHDLLITKNKLASGTGSALIQVDEGSRGICVSDNTDADGKSIDLTGQGSNYSTWHESAVSRVGPAALATDGAQHLNFATLTGWIDRTQTKECD